MTKAEATAYIKGVWTDHEKAQPIRDKKGVALATHRWPMTIPHAMFDEVMDHLDPLGDNPDWAYLRSERAKAVGCVSHNYAGAWVKAILDALTSAKPIKEG